MRTIIQVRISTGENQYVAECLDLPVVTQGRTLDELAENLKGALALHLEGEDLSQFDALTYGSTNAELVWRNIAAS